MTQTENKYPFKEPFLSKPLNDDLTKQWIIEYGIWSEQEQKLKRKRVVLVGKPVEEERLADSKLVISELKKRLKAGPGPASIP